MTYGSRLRAEHRNHREGNWPNGRRTLPGWLFDRMAEQKLTGGYRTKPNRRGVVRNPICPNCFVAKSNSGTCNC